MSNFNSIQIKDQDTAQLVTDIVESIFKVKAENVVLMDLREIDGVFTDFFIVCSGNSDTQIKAIADKIVKDLKDIHRMKSPYMEGYRTGEWVLIDLHGIVIHIFSEEKRNFFRLESLWADAKIEKLEDK